MRETYTHIHTERARKRQRKRDTAHFHHLASPDFVIFWFACACVRLSLFLFSTLIAVFSVFNSFHSISIKLHFNGIKTRFITNQWKTTMNSHHCRENYEELCEWEKQKCIGVQMHTHQSSSFWLEFPLLKAHTSNATNFSENVFFLQSYLFTLRCCNFEQQISVSRRSRFDTHTDEKPMNLPRWL